MLFCTIILFKQLVCKKLDAQTTKRKRETSIRYSLFWKNKRIWNCIICLYIKTRVERKMCIIYADHFIVVARPDVEKTPTCW